MTPELVTFPSLDGFFTRATPPSSNLDYAEFLVVGCIWGEDFTILYAKRTTILVCFSLIIKDWRVLSLILARAVHAQLFLPAAAKTSPGMYDRYLSKLAPTAQAHTFILIFDLRFV